MVPRQQFLGARLKVARAERHLRELIATIVSILDTDFAVIRSDEDGNSAGTYTLNVDTTAPYPPEIPTIIGDAVHNLRTALDHIVVQFTDPESGWLSLPMAKGRCDVKALLSFRTIQKTNADFAAFILDEIQPYAGGKFKLWEIGQLDNIDKHKLLIPTVNFSSLGRFDVEDEHGNRFVDNLITVPQGTVTAIVSGMGKMKINHKGDSGVNIVFGEDTPFPGESVLGALSNLPELMLEAIEALESFCFGTVAIQAPSHDDAAPRFRTEK